MTAPTNPAYGQIRLAVQRRLADVLDDTPRNGKSPTITREMIAGQLGFVLEATAGDVKWSLSPEERERLIEELRESISGLGPLEPLLDDPEIAEIMVNGPSQIYVERQGRLQRVTATFRDSQHLMSVIERLLDSAGVSLRESEPYADASLPNGMRINVIAPPLVLNGPTLTIRKKLKQWAMQDFVFHGALGAQITEFLQACVRARVNLIISGGTSSGKTTLVSILSSFMEPEERIITIENVAELELAGHEHWVRLVARASNMEGRGEVPLRMLVRNALRMRPDRIILGEARGGEALDVVQAMSTGHEGVITVLHANSAKTALERLETLMLMSGLELLPQACRTQIAGAVDLIIHVGRFADGTRCVSSVAQVLGATAEGFQLEELFTLDVRGHGADGALDAELRYTGVRPKILSKFRLHNVEVPGWMK